MKILLDTCTFLWICFEPSKLSDRAKKYFKDPSNDVFLSSISTWEIAVKYSLKRLEFPEKPSLLIPELRKQHFIQELSLNEESTFRLLNLPNYHKDSFDRMLICQAIQNAMAILSPDEAIEQYPVQVIW